MAVLMRSHVCTASNNKNKEPKKDKKDMKEDHYTFELSDKALARMHIMQQRNLKN